VRIGGAVAVLAALAIAVPAPVGAAGVDDEIEGPELEEPEFEWPAPGDVVQATDCFGRPLFFGLALEVPPGGAQFHGTPGDDVILGTDGADWIDGEGGDDTICGGRGADDIWGSEGNDDIKGGAGEDYLVDDLGYDVIYGGSHDDQIFTGRDADYLDGGDGDDVLACGWFGDDYDTAYGGLGYGDTFDDCEDASG
jgi:hypothetical protein